MSGDNAYVFIIKFVHAFSCAALFFILVLTLKPEFKWYTEYIRESIMQKKKKNKKDSDTTKLHYLIWWPLVVIEHLSMNWDIP